MKKQDKKYIQQIADRLPVVYDQTVSGYYEEDGEKKPNLVTHPINHERRLRKAYESLGIEGIKSYLDYIFKIQQEYRTELEKHAGL
jgi:hypothetical protein